MAILTPGKIGNVPCAIPIFGVLMRQFYLVFDIGQSARKVV